MKVCFSPFSRRKPINAFPAHNYLIFSRILPLVIACLRLLSVPAISRRAGNEFYRKRRSRSRSSRLPSMRLHLPISDSRSNQVKSLENHDSAYPANEWPRLRNAISQEIRSIDRGFAHRHLSHLLCRASGKLQFRRGS